MALAIGNDNRVWLYGLLDTTTGTYVNNAVLTFNVTDPTGAVVASGITMNYVAGSNGNYIGILPASTVLVAGTQYTFVEQASNYNVKHTFTEYAQTG